tara:strand:- start:27825 stop:28835 length:1011 start_codon:yes stop_codon:yes gene_type:complete
MKVLIIGMGSIGKRHMKNLLSAGVLHSDIIAVDTREDRRNEVISFGVNDVYETIESALANCEIDASIICSPTHLHMDHAITLAKKGIHIMIEKPLSCNLDGITILKDEMKKNNIIVMMAYIFRFSPLTKKVKELLDTNMIGKILYCRGEFSEYLPDWHKYEDYRSFYMAEKSQGGGSILDQSHIFDLIHFLLGSFESVIAFNSKISSLEINADDIAELIVKLKSGVIASIHTDIFGRDHKKYLEIKGENGNILWDFYSNKVILYQANDELETVFDDFEEDFNLVYMDEIQHFINLCNNNDEVSISPLDDGIETMELILSAEKSHNLSKAQKINQTN